MDESWDELMSNLPSEPCPPGLVTRVQLRLGAERRRQRWLARGTQLILASSAALSAWLLVRDSGSLAAMIPSPSLAGLQQWLVGLAASPQGAVAAAASGAVALGTSVSAGISATVLLALILLAPPATYLTIALLKEPSGRRGVLA